MAAPNGQLSSLVKLISEASQTVEAHFAKSSKPYVPSLDDVEPHPLDLVSDSMELRTAIQTIEGACAQLIATVLRPSHTIMNRAMGMLEPGCMDVVMAYKIPDILRDQPAGVHVADIAKRTGLEEHRLGRTMRLLATKHIFREISKDVFVNNRLSVQLLSENPMSNLCRYNTQELQGAIPFLTEVLGDEDWGHSTAPNKTAFNRHTGYSGTMFNYYSGIDTKIGAEFGERFTVAMHGYAVASESLAVIHEFPWKELPTGTTIVDVAGGVGYMALELARRFPSLHLTLQDLPERILEAKHDLWPSKCPKAIEESRIKFVPFNFFIQSPVSNADIYYIRNILHDWEDSRCITILSNVRKAMSQHSRVLVHECILQDAARVPEGKSLFKQAPVPLLPNYGVGRVRQYAMDVAMMTMFNSEERHLQAYIRLGETSGLAFVKLWDFGESGIVEFRIAQDSSCDGHQLKA
ncbi:O-methyltransferase-domain-containing protein [Pholiota molesta]|nr:O-methyltransferase-domain-containing protein [Pholiota molesta]